MAAADPGEGQVDDGLRGVAHEPKLLGRRHASPRLDLALLDRRRRVAGERSRPARGVSDRHPAIIGSLRVEVQILIGGEHIRIVWRQYPNDTKAGRQFIAVAVRVGDAVDIVALAPPAATAAAPGETVVPEVPDVTDATSTKAA